MNSAYRTHTNGCGFGTMIRPPQAIKTVYLAPPQHQPNGGAGVGGLGDQINKPSLSNSAYKEKKGHKRKSTVKRGNKKGGKKLKASHHKKSSKFINF